MTNQSAKVLVVDDEKVVIQAIKKILSLENYQVDYVYDAQTGIERISQESYSVIISDIMLPDISGFDLLSLIKANTMDTPVILITGYATIENALRALNNGAFDFITKPFEIEEILATVKRAIAFGEKSRQKSVMDKWQNFFSIKPADANFYFLGLHSWIKKTEKQTLEIGIGESMAGFFDSIEKIELPEINEKLTQGRSCGQIYENMDTIHHIWSPISGLITEINGALATNPELINNDPYGQGWLMRLIPENFNSEIKSLVFRK